MKYVKSDFKTSAGAEFRSLKSEFAGAGAIALLKHEGLHQTNSNMVASVRHYKEQNAKG